MILGELGVCFVLDEFEGGTGKIYIHLAKIPASDVDVTVTSGDPAITVSPASLTFTALNYMSDQEVTLTGETDANTIDENVTITASGSGRPDATWNVTAPAHIAATVIWNSQFQM